MNTIHLTQNEQKQYNWLGLGNINKLNLPDPLNFSPDCDARKEFFRLLLQPEYFYFTAKYIFNVELLPYQVVVLQQLWNHKFPMLIASRGAGKSFLLGLYALMRMSLLPSGRKIVICGAGFRQSKLIYEYMMRIWEHAPMLRNIAGNNDGSYKDPDQWMFKLNGGVTYAIPLGDGSRIRGLRANDIISDEFASINLEIFQTVIQGFGAVAADPVSNVKHIAELNYLKEQGLVGDNYEYENENSNQTILSGTAYYDFNWFAKYYKDYKAFIKSRGDKEKVRHLFADGEVPKHFNHKDYAITRIPYELIPEGFMDDAQISRAKATSNSIIYNMEYGAVFPKDSMGFFKRSLLETCVTTDGVHTPDGIVQFSPRLYGDPRLQYVIGVDPASEDDNLSIVILELHPHHRRVVYCWTINKQRHKAMLKKDNTIDDDYYAFIARKIRILMSKYNVVAIAMDHQGGGIAIEEALQARKNLQEGEVQIWPIIIEGEEQPTDDEQGLHILHNINFSQSEWVGKANHGLRADFENKRVLFPKYDDAEVGIIALRDANEGREYDTLEDALIEIEELKTELSIIQLTQTAAGRDRWDTPEIKLSGSKKGRLKKDRYSALLMANAVGHDIFFAKIQDQYYAGGGLASELANIKPNGPFATGPAWWVEKMKELGDMQGIGINSFNRNGVY